MIKMNEIVVYTPERPMVTSDGGRMVSVEALRPGHCIVLRSHGYVGDVAPVGWHMGMVIGMGPPEPVLWGAMDGESPIVAYQMEVLLSAGEVYLDRRSVIEGTIYEFVC